jgi:hypothetical protein
MPRNVILFLFISFVLFSILIQKYFSCFCEIKVHIFDLDVLITGHIVYHAAHVWAMLVSSAYEA